MDNKSINTETKNMRKKTITLNWSYPVRYSNAYDRENCFRNGIYYISRVFEGKELLIYIGKTIDCFWNRMKSHEETWLASIKGEKWIRFGSIVSPKVYDNDLIEDIESAIIYEVQPDENWMKTCSYTYRSGYFVSINNTGYRGVLPKIIDSKSHI